MLKNEDGHFWNRQNDNLQNDHFWSRRQPNYSFLVPPSPIIRIIFGQNDLKIEHPRGSGWSSVSQGDLPQAPSFSHFWVHPGDLHTLVRIRSYIWETVVVWARPWVLNFQKFSCQSTVIFEKKFLKNESLKKYRVGQIWSWFWKIRVTEEFVWPPSRDQKFIFCKVKLFTWLPSLKRGFLKVKKSDLPAMSIT